MWECENRTAPGGQPQPDPLPALGIPEVPRARILVFQSRAGRFHRESAALRHQPNTRWALLTQRRNFIKNSA